MLLKNTLGIVLALGLCGMANAESMPLPALGETFWGLGSTGIICDEEPCPRHGVFPMKLDGTRGLPLSDEDQPEPPALQADDVTRSRIEAAFDQGRCVVAEGHFDGDTLVVRRLMGDCRPVPEAPTTWTPSHSFTARANALCRTILDARDYQTFKAARDGSMDLIIAQMRGKDGAPSGEEAKRLTALLAAVNTDLAATIVQLRTLPPSPALEAYLDYGQAEIDVNTARIGFLADLENWQWPLADSLNTNRYDYIQGMQDLGFVDRDCAHVFSSLGNYPERADFIPIVAPACNVAYDRLVRQDLDQWRRLNLNALAAVLQDKPQDPAATPALRQLADVWKEAAHAFRLVDSKIEDRPPLWEDTIAILYERARIFDDRANALEYRDEDAIKEAFANRIITPDFEQLGLRETSCMALITLM